MRTTRLLVALAVAAGLASGSAADDKAAKKAKKKDAAPPPAAKPEPTATAEPLKPALVGGTKNPLAVAAAIDSHIDRRLSEEKVAASPACTDAEFARRAYLDVTGVVPTADQAKAFLDDKATDKRAKLIDALLASPNFGRRQADIWTGLLVERTSDNRFVDFNGFRDWLAGQFAANRPWNETVSDLVAGSGEQAKNPAVGFYLANNTVDKMTDEVCKSFLGLQLQCAQCHNHPFTGWKQTEYWAMAQFFMKVRVGGLGRDQTPAVDETNALRRNKKNELPEAAKTVPAKFLMGASPALDPKADYRPALAAWLTGKTNPFFAKAMVNRTWAGFFGVGLVNPIDDMHGANEATHPELLDALAADFAASGFDVKHLVKAICSSRAYQRSARPTSGNEAAGPTLYARMPVKVLTPEQLFDSVNQITGFGGDQTKGRDKAVKGFQPTARDRFVSFYLAGADVPAATEYGAGIPQALKLMNAKPLNNVAVVRKLLDPKATAAANVETLYLTVLARRPTDAEAAKLTAFVSKTTPPQDAYADVLWALLNTTEFAVNR